MNKQENKTETLLGMENKLMGARGEVVGRGEKGEEE